MSRDNQTPWYIETFLAFGGWVAGLLAAIAIFALAAAMVVGVGRGADEAGAVISLIVGAGFVLFSVSVSHPDRGDFMRHFAIAAAAAGLTAATGGVWYLLFSLFDLFEGAEVLSIGSAGLVTAALLAVAGYFISRKMRDGILSFLVTLAVYGVATAALIVLHDDAGFGWRTDLYLAAPVAALGCWLFVNAPDGPLRRPAGAALLVAPMLHYALVRDADFLFRASDSHQTLLISEALFMAAAAYSLWTLRTRYRLLPLIASGAISLVAIWFLPSAGAVAIVMLLTALAANHRGLAIVAIVAVIWFISRFYYDLSMTLLEKSALMAGLGAATLIGALFFHRMDNRNNARREHTPPATRRGMLAVLGVGSFLIVSLGLVNQSVWRLETQFGGAREIYLPLGPRDPRSILQGDYMVLNYRNDIYPAFGEIEALPRDGEVFLKLDENDVVSFSRIPGPNDAPGPDEIRIGYVKTAETRMRYAPESFFFQEGEAEIYQPARFAIVRVAPAGHARLVGLADENRARLGPDD